MHDGTTPLILAARLAVEGMVEELINCHADVNAIDDFGKYFLFVWRHLYEPKNHCNLVLNVVRCWGASKDYFRSNNPVLVSSGKSALHWAAAVNNVEAAIVLLKNGANKDMQNNKV